MNLLFVSLLFSLSFPQEAPDNMPKIAEAYINQYKDVAVSEMHRVGIPASIKLAQGLLESDWGRSNLATEANNHFGIKCGNNWTGGSFFKEDDDYQNGKLINSCFRKYNDALQSYIDHSTFLSKPRYSDLFEFDRRDYKSWAKGLRKAGYATDRRYPQKLITIIEKYDLAKYDLFDAPDEKILAHTPKTETIPTDIPDEEIVFKHAPKDEEIYRSEHIEAVEISSANVEKERSVAYEGQEVHYVKEDETMEDIARLHKIELNQLYFKNRMPLGAQPVAGELLKLKGKLRLDGPPKYIRFPKKEASEFLF